MCISCCFNGSISRHQILGRTTPYHNVSHRRLPDNHRRRHNRKCSEHTDCMDRCSAEDFLRKLWKNTSRAAVTTVSAAAAAVAALRAANRHDCVVVLVLSSQQRSLRCTYHNSPSRPQLRRSSRSRHKFDYETPCHHRHRKSKLQESNNIRPMC